jgi:hypothetical protein
MTIVSWSHSVPRNLVVRSTIFISWFCSPTGTIRHVHVPMTNYVLSISYYFTELNYRMLFC